MLPARYQPNLPGGSGEDDDDDDLKFNDASTHRVICV